MRGASGGSLMIKMVAPCRPPVSRTSRASEGPAGMPKNLTGILRKQGPGFPVEGRGRGLASSSTIYVHICIYIYEKQ